MNYQQVPFYIWSEDLTISKKIANIIGRKSNTYAEALNRKTFFGFLDSCHQFTCFVLHYKGNVAPLAEQIKAIYKKNPFFPIFLISFGNISTDEYRQLIRSGVSDVFVYDESNPVSNIQREMLKVLNLKWKGYRSLFNERRKYFKATIVTAHHEINQPLTVILNSVGLLNLELKKLGISEPTVKKYFGFIVRGANRIQNILDELKKIESPVLKEYTTGVPMLDMWNSTSVKENENRRTEKTIENGLLVIAREDQIEVKIKQAIESLGFQPIFVQNGEQATRVFNRMLNGLSAILLDIEIFSEDLDDLFFDLRVHSIHVPIIILAGSMDDPRVIKLMENGAHAVISKPLSSEELKKVLFQSTRIEA